MACLMRKETHYLYIYIVAGLLSEENVIIWYIMSIEGDWDFSLDNLYFFENVSANLGIFWTGTSKMLCITLVFHLK